MEHTTGNRTAGFSNAEKDRLRKESNSDENTKDIGNHVKAAEHFSCASKHHYDAARYHEEGHHEKASHSTLLAIGHASLANEHQLQDAQHHATEN